MILSARDRDRMQAFKMVINCHCRDWLDKPQSNLSLVTAAYGSRVLHVASTIHGSSKVSFDITSHIQSLHEM